MDLFAELTLDGVAIPAVLDRKSGKGIYAEALLQNAAYVGALVEMGHATPPVAGVIVGLPKVETDPAFEVRVITAAEHAVLFEAFQAVKCVWDSPGSVGDLITGIRPGCSLGLAWPGLTAPPAPARPFGRSVRHPGSGIVRTPGGTRGTSGRHRCSGKDRRRRR
jgi:hypothetical protein